MKSEIPLHIKIAILILTVVFLLLVNPFAESKKGRLQNDFDLWLNASRDTLSKPSLDAPPSLEISLKSDSPSRVFSWQIRASADPVVNQKILRLLQQAREANLFDIESKSPKEVTLEIRDNGNDFKSSFSFADIKNNIKAAVFLELFEEYAGRS